jgi:hypothetical protein
VEVQTSDLYRVFSAARQAQPSKTKQQTAPKAAMIQFAPLGVSRGALYWRLEKYGLSRAWKNLAVSGYRRREISTPEIRS